MDECKCGGEHEAAKPVLSSKLLSAHAGDSHGGDAFLTSDKTEALVGGGFDADLVRLDAQSGGDVLLHSGGVRLDAWCLGDEAGIDILDAHALFSGDLGAFFEDFEAADAFDGGIAGRKPVPNVGFTKSTENGVGNGVAENVGIGMALQTTAVWDGDSSEHKRAALSEGMYVVTNASANHKK
jgi:hypothetical protein